MSSSERSATEPFLSSRLALIVAGILSASALGGCSADLARFDMASASFNSDAPRARTAPLPAEGLRRGGDQTLSDAVPPPPSQPYSYSPAPYSPPASTAPVRQAGLPEPIMRDAPPAKRGAEPVRREPAPRAPIALGPVGSDSGGQRMIDVQQGDTIYGLAKRHKVSISELMSANSLQTPMIRPGQKLVLPGAARSVPKKREAVASAPALPSPTRTSAPASISASDPPSDWTGSHTVSPRDTLSTIARRYNIKAAELQAANGIADPTKVRAGTVLKVPGGAGRGIASAAPAPEAQPAGPAEGSIASSSPIARPTIINASSGQTSERVAAVNPPNPTVTDAVPEPTIKTVPTTRPQPAVAGPMKFRWPAKGRVVANFGPRSDNTHNDGINILVPQGTEVMAAEAGTVAYAGSELKGYGNLVLIRHEGNWVSAYAHNDALLVKRGDRVERGQAIAKAGKTGAVDQPQVHFELRQGSKPVDPMPHLEK